MTFQFQGLEVHSVPPPINGRGWFNAHVKCQEQLRHCRCPAQYFDLERASYSLDLSAFNPLFLILLCQSVHSLSKETASLFPTSLFSTIPLESCLPLLPGRLSAQPELCELDRPQFEPVKSVNQETSVINPRSQVQRRAAVELVVAQAMLY